ncbi:hypothetical protein LTR35_001990 [Friedmanniomyces endolithicus]|uniref:Uncharacterized protein n=1 Tax=Friedmanniomyces endolithicus TaxID=329885 RepID=A0AAN6JCT0_9PEZI|nr:hypothetical protein LTS00_010298 [Friedmanniomyces endolithicus]KAK0291267.1 hypothetical protein LTR35_001990 [Friedmanniomyces endolithicus]KAK0325205.1 hypothetical protein LTR82_003486 [Friedmanniomyces endolithicus]KAK0998872.1 hypothetical protein LTR54_009312 [Friedmanniomyces endolithicus]
MASITTTVLATLAALSSAAALPGSSSHAPKFPSASISLYNRLFCAADSLIAGTPFDLKAGTCRNSPSNTTYISANICLSDAVPWGYECKVILYSDTDCAGAGTATAPLVQGQEACYLKLTASALNQGTVGGQSVGLVCPQLADGSTVA